MSGEWLHCSKHTFLKQSSVMKFMARWGIIYRLRAFDFIGILWHNLFLTARHLHWFTKEGTEALKGQLHDMQAFCRTWLKMRIVSQPLHLDPSTTLGLPCYVSTWGFLNLELHSRCFWKVRRGSKTSCPERPCSTEWGWLWLSSSLAWEQGLASSRYDF